MSSRNASAVLVVFGCLLIAAPAVMAQSFRVQCPTSTITHPDSAANSAEPPYKGPTQFKCTVPNGCGGSAGNAGYMVPDITALPANGSVKCQQVSGGDGYATMADGTQTYLFGFGPLSGLAQIAAGQPGTDLPGDFNAVAPDMLRPGDPATTDDAGGAFTYNGAVGLTGDPDGTSPTQGGVTAKGAAVMAGGVIEDVTITNGGTGYYGPATVSFAPPNCTPGPACETAVGNAEITNGAVTGVEITYAGEGYTNTPSVSFSAPVTSCIGNANLPGCVDGHVDPRSIMDVGVMNANLPAPLIAVDEDDELFLTLTNVGMIMRPDLFEQHTIHFHGYPNASSFYDGVPDASVAINIGGSFTYYYLAPDAGTYFWHCHITPPEHLQMGMVGQIYVRPRQNRVPVGTDLRTSLGWQQSDPRTACNPAFDVLCTNPLPPTDNGATQALDTVGNVGSNPNYNKPYKYAYNDGDGTTRYDVEYPIQIHGFDPNFHFVGMTFNPEGFADMKDKYFLLNGRSYPDTVAPGPIETISSDGSKHYSQPLPAIVNIPVGGRALLRLSDLDVQEHQTLASLGIPMTVIAINAKLLRDQAGHNMYYNTNSITLGGGESLDVILDASDTSKYAAGDVFYLFTPNLDHLSNDAENFGGLMTEVHIVAGN